MPLNDRDYNCCDTDITLRLYDTYMGPERLLWLPNIYDLLDLQGKLEPIADKMTWRGMRVDRTRQAYHHHQLRTRQKVAQKAFVEFTQQSPAFKGRLLTASDNLSPIGLRRYFFEHLGVEPTHFSDDTGEPSLNKAALTEMTNHQSPRVRESARQLLKIRSWKHLDDQFIKRLIMDSDNIAHPFHAPAGALSGRWACKKPNLYNFPNPQFKNVFLKRGGIKRVVIHSGLRDIFVPIAANGWFVSGDYSQIEMRILSYEAEEPFLMRAFENGVDVHNLTAQDLFYKGDREHEIDERERTCSKKVQYTVAYGGNGQTLYNDLAPLFEDFTVSACDEYIEDFYRLRPKIKAFQTKQFEIAKATYLLTDPISGRSRMWWHMPPQPETANMFPQFGAAKVFNDAIQRIDARLDWNKEGIATGLHDAFYLDGPDPMRLARIIQEEMPTSLSINGRTCELPIGMSIGRNFGNMVKVKNLADVKRVIQELS